MSRKDRLWDMDFYLVTDSGLSRNGTLHDVRRAVDAGCRIVQYREKAGSTRDMIEVARVIGDITRGRALFIVNDRVDVALAVDADGVHVGQDDMPYDLARELLGTDKIIGVTVHDVTEAVEAERLGADYIGLSPIFATSTKDDAGAACGTVMIADVRARIGIPIVAIGGISKPTVEEVIRVGADAAVAISAVVSADDVYREVAEFRSMIRRARERSR